MNLYDQVMMSATTAAEQTRSMPLIQRSYAAVYFYGVLAGLCGLGLVEQDAATIDKKLVMLFDLPEGTLRDNFCAD